MSGGRPFQRVAVLMGGPSSEREVSLSSGKAVADGLLQAGYDVMPVDVTDCRLDIPGDVEGVFIALHGAFGEDGGVQRILDERGIPYTGSGAESSRKAFDKILSKQCLVDAGIPTPAYEVVRAGGRRSMPLPVVTKPAREGSSIGVCLVMYEQDWAAALEDSLRHDTDVVVENYIAGRELTVGVIGDVASPVVEIAAPGGWYDYRAKYTAGLTDYHVPASIDPELADQCRELAMETFRAHDARGFGRVDFRLSSEGSLFVIELNSIPGFTQTSLLPKGAAAMGLSFSALCDRIMRMARTG